MSACRLESAILDSSNRLRKSSNARPSSMVLERASMLYQGRGCGRRIADIPCCVAGWSRFATYVYTTASQKFLNDVNISRKIENSEVCFSQQESLAHVRRYTAFAKQLAPGGPCAARLLLVWRQLFRKGQSTLVWSLLIDSSAGNAALPLQGLALLYRV